MAQELPKAEWRHFLDYISRQLIGKQVELEVASLELGDQILAEWLPLLGIAYDPKDDLIEVALEGYDHMILSPRSVYVEGGSDAVMSVEVIDKIGAHEIMKFREPLMLSGPKPH